MNDLTALKANSVVLRVGALQQACVWVCVCVRACVLYTSRPGMFECCWITWRTPITGLCQYHKQPRVLCVCVCGQRLRSNGSTASLLNTRSELSSGTTHTWERERERKRKREGGREREKESERDRLFLYWETDFSYTVQNFYKLERGIFILFSDIIPHFNSLKDTDRLSHILGEGQAAHLAA